MDRFRHLREPLKIGGLTVRNRVMMPTHGPRLPQGRYLHYLEERAKGGAGLIGFNLGPLGIMQFPLGPGRSPIANAGDIDSVPPHPLTAEGKAFYDSQVPPYRAWGEAVRKHGTLAIGQLYHSGAALHTDNFQPAIAPSSVPDEYERHIPHALTTEEIADLVETFALGAKRALLAGFDLVEIHAAHGYLAYQFLSPLTNRRDDSYGGSLENRMRFLIETLHAVCEAVDGAAPVGVRMNGPDPVPGGMTQEDVTQIALRLAQEGAAYLSISGGTYAGLRGGVNLPYVAPALIPPGPNVAAAAAVRAAVAVPVAVTGRIADLDLAEKIVAGGAADFVGMLRAQIADPRLVEKSFSGSGRVAPCIASNECHYGRAVACSVNAAAGREAEMEATRAERPRHVLVVGAGPAGLECAMAAGRRGHRVALIDRSREIGGFLAVLARTSAHAEFGRYLDYAAGVLGDLAIEPQLGVEADPSFVCNLAPDIVVLATGARYGAAPIEADKPGTVFDAARILDDPTPLGRSVAVAGGLDDHLPPLVVADRLAKSGRRVTLLTENFSLAPALEPANLHLYIKMLLEQGVSLRPMTAAVALRDGALTVRNTVTNATEQLAEIDSLVAVGGRLPVDSLAAELKGLGMPVHLIGDALAPRRMLHATLDGARLGLTLD